jgi:photosystem II stability/assembly factor-like uncharacterized protein
MFAVTIALACAIPQIDPASYECLRWRCIGPFRAGRTVAGDGIAAQPNTFFVGANNGGVWKTNDAGRTWRPIFDGAESGSVGAIAVAPSNPDVIWVGSGEGLQRPDLSTGNGVHRSDDGGRTWTDRGLHEAQQIAAVLVDPKDPERVFVAALGHPYGPNEQRGVFRSRDGGKHWDRVLWRDADTGAIALAFDPTDSNVLFADLWESRLAPWENGSWQGPGSGLWKSTDGGDHWRQLSKGLPSTSEGLGRIGFAIAGSDRNRMYAVVDAKKGGIYRSDDAGESWALVCDQTRLWGRGSDFAEVRVDPRDADHVYVLNTSAYRSRDGGKTWTCFKGSPGGDDYHRLWINPLHPEILLVASDQGAIVSVNAGETWSSWYNQPTAQLYHVACDDDVPFHVYAGQQESGSVGISSRGRDGQITFRDWTPVGGDEYAYFAPDPLHRDLVYGGKVTRFHRDTGVVEQCGPDKKAMNLRFLRTAPLVFSPVDHVSLYLAAQVLLRTRDGGASWQAISPDLSREHPEVPACVGKYAPEVANMARRGVIYTVAPSPVDADLIWCGTDDGRIHLTVNGGAEWRDVTPPALTAWSKVSIVDAGHFDRGTAYAAVNAIRLDDERPHVLATHDLGASWTEIVNGLHQAPVNTVREDPRRAGLLFCGTERAVFFSCDDGAHWQSLRQNMPASSVRDLVVHGDDLVVGTHGRSIWVLDDVNLLRALPAAGDAPLLAPTRGVHFALARDLNTDTPLPPDEPVGQNPPDGVAVTYWLPKDAASAVLEIVDGGGAVVRRFRSDDKIAPIDPASLTVMPEWVRPRPQLSAAKGSHRFVWDLRGAPPPGATGEDEEPGSLTIAAIWHDTPKGPLGAVVAPGEYTIRLTVDGVVRERTTRVAPPPR